MRLGSSPGLFLRPLSKEDGRESDGIALDCATFGADVEATLCKNLRALEC